MKQNLLIITLFFSVYSFAQIPTGYYDTATGTAYTLKTQLYNIIKGHTDKGYSGLWITYATSDRDNQYEKDNTILDMYSENPTGFDSYNFILGTNQCGTYSVEGNCYNREHIVPQSVYNSASPMVSDAHFVIPTDGKVNGQRSNYPHGTVAAATWTSLNGTKLGLSAVTGYTGTVFEPINEFKGDIARMYFYFATRYENTVAGYSFPMFNGTSNQVFTTAFLNMLLTWSAQDPVSAKEIARNNAIYAIQNNRNPYIDHPEYVQKIWNPTADIQAPSAPTALAVIDKTLNSITLSWLASTDNVKVTGYNVYINGILKTTVTGLTTSITGLTAATAYSFYVIAKDAAGNLSQASTTINTATTADITAPTAPTSLAVTTKTINSIALSWLASTDNVKVTGYNVYMNSVLKTTVTGLTTTITGLTAATGYSFYVFAKDAAGNLSPASTTINDTTTADTQAPTAATSLAVTAKTINSIALSWAAAKDNIGVTAYNIFMGGVLQATVTGLTTTITGLTPSTVYSFYVIAKDDAGNLSPASAIVSGTTSAPVTATELLFSEYIEGSSNNKALEIANLTGAAVNLAAYSIKKQTNGAGVWSTGLSLTGTLKSGSKYVIVNSLIALACYNKTIANISTTADELTFNGNDAVGLFKNGILIDIIGTFNVGAADFAIDVTLRRKSTVLAPSTTFNKATQWDVFTQDTCNNLGSRMANAVIKGTASTNNEFRIFPNPSQGEINISFDNPKGDYSVEIFSLLGQKVFEKENTRSTNLLIPNLQKGTYVVKITKDSNTTTKKIEIN